MYDPEDLARIQTQLAQVEDYNADTVGAPEPGDDPGNGTMLQCDWCQEWWPLPLLNWSVDLSEKICMNCALDAGELDED